MPTLGGHEEAISPISGHRGKVNIPSSIGLKKDSKLMSSELDLEPSRCRCHLILLLTCAVAIQGGISCGVIWYIGYRASTSIAQSLSSSIYQSLLSNCVLQINARLALPLQATRELKYHIDNRFPDLSNLLTITNQTGFLADISDIAAKYPILTRMGINTRQGLTVGMSRPTSLTNRAYLSDSGFLQVNLAQPATPFAKSVVIDTFIPAASRLPPNRIIYNPPFNITGEILTNDTAESIHYWLGSNRSSSTLNPFTRPYWIAGLELSQRGDSNGWTKIFPTLDIGASSGFIAISALAIELNRNSKELHYVVSSTISLENFNSVLQELPLGQNGKAFLVSSSGHIVSSTESWLIDYLATNRSEFNVWTSQDRLLQSVLNLMHNHKLISSQWTTPTNASLVMHPDAQQYHDSLQLGGQKWHIHMQMMDANSTGLYWTIVVVTLDRDFTGVVDESIITTVWLSIVVSVSFIIISVVITWTCVTKPIKNIASDMKVASSLVGKTQVDRQHLEQICLKWHQHRSSGYGCSAKSTHEVALMNQAFAALVYSLSLHDELKAINQAKRKFIRFIFHEVRVPFNALSLAVNQIESDIHLLRKHIAKEGLLHFTSCIDTLHIMSDQTEVVSKILNDVLSMQQIEDGQLKLASEWISIEATMTAAMNGFGIHCQAKQITMELKSTDLISYIMQQDLSCRQVIEQQKVSNSHLSIGYEVQCDPHRLRQVLANLLSNAIKHTPPNGLITVSLGYENFRPHISQAELDTFATGPIDSIIRLGEISVKIQVFDTGTGITPTAIQHLFDSYNHTYLDPFDIRPGGLGLSITKKLVELFGGTIGVQSRVNYGSVFYFEIPMQVRLRKSPAYTELLPDEDIQITFHDEKSTSHPPIVKLDPVDSFPNNMMPDVKSSLSSTEIVPLGLCPKATYSSSPYIHSRGIEFEKSSPDSLMGHPAHSILPCLPEHKSSHRPLRRRVLVVEDSMPNRKLLMKFLMAIGCDVASVEDGKQCIDLFVQNSPCQFDGIIMDGSMPVMTGVEATRILRERGYAIPIIAVTGNALMEDVDVFMRAGANIVLTKPINKISFTQAVERFIPT